MDTLLLSALYLAGFGGFGLAALGLGFLAIPKNDHRNHVAQPPPAVDFGIHASFRRFWRLILAYGLGLAILSWLTIGFGIIGALWIWTVLPAALALSARGWIRESRSADCAWSGWSHAPLARLWRALPGPARLATAGVAAWCALTAFVILVGGLHPDMGQDALWYHLTVPGQWVIRGRAEAFPLVVPSNYPLAMESVYAAALLVGDEVLCTLLYAQVTLALLAGVVAVAGRWMGARGAFLAAGCVVPFLAACSTAPLPPANDNAAALWLLLGMTLLVETLADPDKHITRSRLLAGGFLIGTATAAKLTVIGYWIPLLVALAGYSLSARRPARQVFRGAGLILAGGAAAYLPWAVRGWLGSGDPFFPLLAGLFPVREAWRGGLEMLGRYNSIYPLTVLGLLEAVYDGIPKKFEIAMISGNVMFLLVLIATAGAATTPRAPWRAQGLALLGLCAATALMRGANETIRYFSIAYASATPALVWTLIRVERAATRRTRTLLVAVMLVGGIFTQARTQWQVAGMRTIRWRFRPVVTAADRQARAEFAEFGHFFQAFGTLRTRLEPAARVLVANCPYVYYLKRDCVWADELCQYPFQKQWKALGPAELHAQLCRRGIGYVVIIPEKYVPPFFEWSADPAVVERFFEPIETAVPAGWLFWKVRP